MKPDCTSKRQKHPLTGKISAPGDKSISHRALILGAMAKGRTEISGLLEGDDILHTAQALREFGAKIERLGEGHWQVEGCPVWKNPKNTIDFGNAGTGARLIMGAAAGFQITPSYKGDASLSARPMQRVIEPLEKMGAKFTSTNGRLPIKQISGGRLKPIKYKSPKASAQLKSAILLAGLNAKGRTEVTESHLSRDHTENMLAGFGVKVGRAKSKTGYKSWLNGKVSLKACKIKVPGDPSSAAFLIASALIVPKSDIIIENVMLNKTRTGLLEVLLEMGADIKVKNIHKQGGEIIGDLHIKHNQLCGVDVPKSRVASMIDEYPILAVIAATAKGKTIMRGLGELRVKESDRLMASHDLLRINGVSAKIISDNLHVEGGAVKGGGLVKTHHDHRIAMSALVLGLVAEKPIGIDDKSMIATSFPQFFELMRAIGADIKINRKPIIAIDGTFASGKGTLAKKLAEYFGFAYLDTGKLYRALAFKALKKNVDLSDVKTLAQMAGEIKLSELDNKDLKSGIIGETASKLAVYPEVRAALLDFQKNFAYNPAAPGAVLDGRDIGTVIAPDADVKLYIDADPKVRARRRYLELKSYGEDVDEQKVLQDLYKRDGRDKSRKLAPLKIAENAYLLDTTNLYIDAAFAKAKSIVLANLEQG